MTALMLFKAQTRLKPFSILSNLSLQRVMQYGAWCNQRSHSLIPHAAETPHVVDVLASVHNYKKLDIFDGLATWLWLLAPARAASRKRLIRQLTILCRTLGSFGSCARLHHQTILRLLHHHTLACLDPEGPDVQLADGIVVLGPARAKPFVGSHP